MDATGMRITSDFKPSINELSDYVLELIFVHVYPYKDFSNVLLVNKRWNRIAKVALTRMKRLFYKCTSFSWRLLSEDVAHSHLLSERCSHAACYHPCDQGMYMFGGCTSTYTAFNDLWFFDLSNRTWERVIISRPPLPSAKALASLVLYNDNLILYGGFSKSSMNPIHQTTTFYNEIHLFSKERTCWEEIICENTAPHLAGHTASIVGDFMLVFGGSMGSSYNNNVYVLDITRRIWNMPSIPGNGLKLFSPCPPPRYGQSQILLDDRHLVIIGGCGGPSVMFNDVWLLDFDLTGDTEWKWTQLKVENLELFPPYLWCHRACKVGNNAVLVSRPTKYSIRRSRHRRTSSQLSNATSSNQRISSPDSPQDRRAVAAAFCSTAITQQQRSNSDVDGGRRAGSVVDGQTVSMNTGNLAAINKKKHVLLSSRSLDEQDKKNNYRLAQQIPSSSNAGANNSGGGGASSSSSNGAYTGQTGNLGGGGAAGGLSINKASELHRACSIPAIIVGEIPKLIVTSSTDCQNQQQPTAKSPSTLVVTNDRRHPTSTCTPSPQHHSSRESPSSQLLQRLNSSSSSASTSPSVADDCNSLDVSWSECSLNNRDVQGCFSKSFINALNESSSAHKYGHTEAVHAFYLSLLKEESDRLRIVELNENLRMEDRLDRFLSDRVPYLSRSDRMDMIREFLHDSVDYDDSDCSTRSGHRQGRLDNARSRCSTASEADSGYLPARFLTNNHKNSLETQPSTSSSSMHRPSFSSSNGSGGGIFGQSYCRHMCVYVLRLHDAISAKTVRWEQLAVEEDSPEDIILYSICAASGELILFGGMQSDGGNGMDCLNVGMDRHMMNSDTFILRPRYNEM